MTVIEENHLCFEFDSTWDHVEKWDKSPAFLTGIQRVAGIKALDIVAFSHKHQECLLLEIKDYRDQNEQPRREGDRKHSKIRRTTEDAAPSEPEPETADELIKQVAKKVVGTVAGLVGTARMQDQPPAKKDFAKDLANALAAHKSAGFKVRVVLWVEGEPTSKGKSPRSKVNLATLTGLLKREVHWLTERPVQALSTASLSTIPGLKVTDNRK